MKRRVFLAIAGAAVAAGPPVAVLAGPTTAAAGQVQRSSTRRLDRQEWTNLVGETLDVQLPDGSFSWLTVLDVVDRPFDHDLEQFTVTFAQVAGAPFDSGLAYVRHWSTTWSALQVERMQDTETPSAYTAEFSLAPPRFMSGTSRPTL